MPTVEHVQLSEHSDQAADWGLVPGKGKKLLPFSRFQTGCMAH
jgi:hypothetical protein